MKLLASSHRRQFLTAASCCGLALAGSSFSSAQAQTYSAPITITDANCGTTTSPSCTFSGNWESMTDLTLAAVTIKTSRAVTIENSRVRGKGPLISAPYGYSADVTVRNTRGYGVNPNVAGKQKGRFFSTEKFHSVTIENCYLEGTTGIYLLTYTGGGTAGNTVKIRYNVSRNIDGRLSDGNGDYQTTNSVPSRQFVQFNNVNNIPDAEISWNDVINYPKQSRVEDNINMYISSGVAASPIAIHDNYIQGAYSADPNRLTAGTTTDKNYSGGGIMLSDGSGDTACNYVTAYNNQVVSTSNYGIAITGGHDNNFHDNRVISCGYLPDGTGIADMNVGIYIVKWHDGVNHDQFYNNTAKDNVVGYRHSDGTYNTWWFPNGGNLGTTQQGSITIDTEIAERKTWTDNFANVPRIGPTTEEANLVLNPSFDAQAYDTQTPSSWSEWNDINASKIEALNGAHTGARHATHWDNIAYEVSTYQIKTGLADGLYKARVWVRSSGGQEYVRLLAKDYGGATRFVDVPTTNTWTRISLPDIAVTNGQCRVEIYSKAGADQWMYFDDVELRKQ